MGAEGTGPCGIFYRVLVPYRKPREKWGSISRPRCGVASMLKGAIRKGKKKEKGRIVRKDGVLKTVEESGDG